MTSSGPARRPRRVVPPDCDPRFTRLHGWLHMTSSGWYLHVDDVLAEPNRVALLSEDACWYLSYLDWERRRPRRWQGRAWRSWRKEEWALAAEQERIVRAALAVHTLRPQSSP
jgi:hypothetical protein